MNFRLDKKTPTEMKGLTSIFFYLLSGMKPSDFSAKGCRSDVTGHISGVMIGVSQELRVLTSSTSCSDKTRTLDQRWRATKRCSYSESSLKIMSLRMSKDVLEKRILMTMDVYIGAVKDIEVVWGMNSVHTKYAIMWFLINSSNIPGFLPSLLWNLFLSVHL